MTAAEQYAALRAERVRCRAARGELSQEEEAEFAAKMDFYWEQMTQEEQQAVEES